MSPRSGWSLYRRLLQQAQPYWRRRQSSACAAPWTSGASRSPIRTGRRCCSGLASEDHYCIVYNGGERHIGLSEEALRQLSEEADLLLNISGHLPLGSPLMQVPRHAYIDVAPGFTQIWAHQVDMGFAQHTHFFTIGQTVGTADFDVPLRGTDWRVMRPPVALHEWPACTDERFQRFSIIADWRGSQGGSQEAIYEGVYHGGKRGEFVKYLRLPLLTGERFELVLCIGQHDHEDLSLLDGHSWTVRNFAQYASNVDSYREFIQHSRAEFSIAKAGYVRSGSGDRMASYLAAGKPARWSNRPALKGTCPRAKGFSPFARSTKPPKASNPSMRTTKRTRTRRGTSPKSTSTRKKCSQTC